MLVAEMKSKAEAELGCALALLLDSQMDTGIIQEAVHSTGGQMCIVDHQDGPGAGTSGTTTIQPSVVEVTFSTRRLIVNSRGSAFCYNDGVSQTRKESSWI